MKEVRIQMGMPVTVEICDPHVTKQDFKKVFDYFDYIDQKFSTYKKDSEISRINRGELNEQDWSEDMKTVFKLSAETKKLTNGYFDIKKPDDSIDPSGLVKGWAIWNSAKILDEAGFKNFFVDAGGDIQTRGLNLQGVPWVIGVKNPFNQNENVKIVHLNGEGIATSGTYIRGQHIYNPLTQKSKINDILSITVISENIYEADRVATAAFAMGKEGINFIESLDGFEGYMIDINGIGTETTNFNKYIHA